MGRDTISQVTVETDASRSHHESPKDNERLTVNENHVLQERRIGVLGAISLVVNKIVGAG